MHPPAVACCRCRCHVSMSMVILHGAGSVAVCCSGCSHSFSLTISEQPAIMHKPCTCSVVLFLLLLLGGSSMMTSTPEVLPYLRACPRRCASIPTWPSASSAIQQKHETRDWILLQVPRPPSAPHRGQEVARPAVAPPSDHRLVLALGWSDTSNGSLNYDIVLGTPQPVSGPSVLGRFRKGVPPQPWHRPHTQYSAPSNPATQQSPGPVL